MRQREPYSQDQLRLAVSSARQCLRIIQGYPAELLCTATFPTTDAAEHGTIEEALSQIDHDLQLIATAVANQRAAQSLIEARHAG